MLSGGYVVAWSFIACSVLYWVYSRRDKERDESSYSACCGLVVMEASTLCNPCASRRACDFLTELIAKSYTLGWKVVIINRFGAGMDCAHVEDIGGIVEYHYLGPSPRLLSRLRLKHKATNMIYVAYAGFEYDDPLASHVLMIPHGNLDDSAGAQSFGDKLVAQMLQLR